MGVGAVTALLLLKAPMFEVQTVTVSPLSQTDTAPALAAAGIAVNGPMIVVDESEAERLLEDLPTVVSASVSSDWPHVVSVSVVERRPIAMAPTADGRWARIGEGGMVMAITDTPEPGLPVPVGVVVEATPGLVLDGPSKALTEVAGMMPPSLRPRVTQVMRDEQGLRLLLSGGAVVQMGDDSAVPDKLLAAATVASKVDLSEIAIIDVTLPRMPLAIPR